jgi:hypothetical protein
MKYHCRIILTLIAVFTILLQNVLYQDYLATAQFKNSVGNSSNHERDNSINITSNFPFSVSLTEKNDVNSSNSISQLYKKLTFKFQQYVIKKRAGFQFSKEQYLYDIDYIYQKEKKSDLIYPFHFFM